MAGSYHLFVLPGLCACVWVLVLGLHFRMPGEPGMLGAAAMGAGFLSTVLAVWPFVRAVAVGPRIQGTWWGDLHSSYADPATGRTPGPIAVALVIRHSAAGVSICLHSRESSSSTIAASLITDPDGHIVLVGLYRNEPRLPRQDTSRMHHGGIKLQVINGLERRLYGTYWTDRGTRGEFDLRFVDRQRAHDFVEASKFAEAKGVALAGGDVATNALADSAPVFVESPTQIMSSIPSTPDQAFEKLLLDRFNEAELRQFVVTVASREALARLPSGGVPLITVVAEVVALFRRDRLIDESLCRLSASSPRRRADIEVLRRRFSSNTI